MHKWLLPIAAFLLVVSSASYATWDQAEASNQQDFRAWEVRIIHPTKEAPNSFPPVRKNEWEQQALCLASASLAVLCLLVSAWTWWLDER